MEDAPFLAALLDALAVRGALSEHELITVLVLLALFTALIIWIA